MSTPPSHDAALYVLGCLAEPEAVAFEAHLPTCPDCTAEVEQLRQVTSALALLAPAADPPAELRGRLLERVAAAESVRAADRGASASSSQSWKNWVPSRSDGAPVVLRADAAQLEPTGVAGVSAKALFVDPASDRITLLVRVEPGATYPAHRHGGAEESYILEGDLSDGEVSLRAGDYLRKDGGTVHEAQSSDTGCFMLIVASLRDEIVPESPRV